MTVIKKDEKPGSSRACLVYPTLFTSVSKLINSPGYYEMTFNECMHFVMKDSRGHVNPSILEKTLEKIFNDRGLYLSKVK